MQKPELISFKTCPFVQRSVILLNEKQVDFDINFIELDDKPDWFLKISPLGKVPVLRVGDAVVFESAVIAEYLDEVYPPSMHPESPIARAQMRAWMEFGSTLISAIVKIGKAQNEAELTEAKQTTKEKLTQLEQQVKGPFFNGDKFALVDAAFAPCFIRLDVFKKLFGLDLLSDFDKLSTWSENLLMRDSINKSKVSDYDELIAASLKKQGSCLAKGK